MSNSIPIKNIYYFLAYVFSVLQTKTYEKLGREDFENSKELLTEILLQSCTKLLKNGLNRGYINVEEKMSLIRGKVNLSDTIRNLSNASNKIVCLHDEYTEDIYLNRLIKTTFLVLLKSDISVSRKKRIRANLQFFKSVNTVDIHRINSKYPLDRHTASYRLIVFICSLILNNFIQNKNSDGQKNKDFLDKKQLSYLYEKFILAYYIRHFPKLKPNASEIKWADLYSEDCSLLPIMRTDITLTSEDNTKSLIIDAKFYNDSLQKHHEKKSIISGHLYQIFAYVKNKSLLDKTKKVSGLLLYAKTEFDMQPKAKYSLSGNVISVDNLDLSKNFYVICEQLNNIVYEWDTSLVKKSLEELGIK